MSLSRKDIEELKPAIERCAQKVIGSDDPTVVSAALSCLDKGYEKKKTIIKLTSLMKEPMAIQFADKVYTVFKDYLNISEVSRKVKRKVTEETSHDDKHENKKPKLVKEVNSNNNSTPAANSFGEFTPDKIKEMMANAQKMIQERKNQLNFTMPQQPVQAPPLANLLQHEIFAVDANEKMKKANELQARIQAKLATVGLNNVVVPIPNSVGTGPTPVILDEHGRTIDPLTGQAIQLQHHTPTLKANIRAKKREQFKAVQERPPEEMSHSKFFDFRLSGNKAIVRSRKTFKFYEPGKFEKIGQRMRTKAQLEKLNFEISLAAKKTGIASAAKLAIIQPKKDCPDEVPEVEWWDAVILRNENSYPDVSEFVAAEHTSSSADHSATKLSMVFEGVTHLVEHPIQMKPPGKSDKPIEIPVMLTKKERKKLRKQNRSEVQKEIQEKIRLGLMPPPEPKVRMANLMRVLGTEAVSDPTRVEAHVRAQMAKRQKAHEDANAARKLTKEQKRQKKIKKIKEDTSCGVVVSVYRVGDLASPAKKFKIEANANQLFMTGIVILHKDCNVIVVEGGPKQQRKFRRLLMNRIKWTDDRNKNANDDDDDDDEEDSSKSDKCKLIWEGMVKNRSFGEIKFKTCPTEAYAKEQFRKHGVEHYWDLSFSSTILETTMPSG